MTDLLTTNQVQALLQVNRTTIYRMVESGRLPAIRVGKQWRFSRSDIERWLQTQAVAAVPAGAMIVGEGEGGAPQLASLRMPVDFELRDLLPKECSQLIQDAFADMMGVMIVITDMLGNPVTQISNPCGFYTALTQDPRSLAQCIRSWQDLATNPAIAPKFIANEMGLLCARGLIRVDSELKGMAVIGGIAPDVWPPSTDKLECLAQTYGLSISYVQANSDAVYHLDRVAQEKALRSVQRIADIFSHIAGDRNAICGRMQAIASLARLSNT